MNVLEEKTSRHFGVPFVYSPEYKLYVCNNGVWFKENEFEQNQDNEDWLQQEFMARQEATDIPLIDYDRLKNDGVLTSMPRPVKVIKNNPVVEETIPLAEPKIIERPEPVIKENLTTEKTPFTVQMICIALGIVSLVSMYISTVHTATYLFDYVDVISAWLMSAVITVYSSTAFEVVILFHERKRHILSCMFALLWTFVTMFSMVTTVSVFYDRFNFNTVQNSREHREEDGARLALEVLKNEETSLKDSIKFKQEEIEYRRMRDYATHTRTLELEELQASLKENLKQQKEILQKLPEAATSRESNARKETLFAFLGRIWNMEGGILEFIMSTLSAIFVNLISPLSLTVVVSLKGGKE